MEQSELDEILGKSGEATDAATMNTDQLSSTSMMRIPDDEEDGVRCDYPGCDATFHGVMGRAQLGRHKSAKHGIKKTDAQQKLSIKPMTATESQAIQPENLVFLQNVLKSFGAKNASNILAGMADNPTNLDELRDLLGANDNKANVPYILKRYSNYLGQPLSSDMSGNAISHVEPNAFDDILARKKKEADMRMYDSYIGGGGNNNNQIQQLIEQNKLLQQQLIENKRESEIKELKEQNQALFNEIKRTKEEAESSAGHLANSMKDFATNISHVLEKKEIESTFTKELQAIQKKLDEQNISKTATNSAELGSKVIDKAAALLGDAGHGFNELNKALTNANSKIDVGDRALALLNRGMSPSEVAAILGGNPVVRNPGLNAAEVAKNWEQMARAVEKEPQPPMDVIEKAAIGINKVKFAGDQIEIF